MEHYHQSIWCYVPEDFNTHPEVPRGFAQSLQKTAEIYLD
jgi:hypothetical protein